MKKIAILWLMCVFCSLSMAQAESDSTLIAQPKYIVPDSANLIAATEIKSASSKAVHYFGFHIGMANAKLPYREFSFRPGVVTGIFFRTYWKDIYLEPAVHFAFRQTKNDVTSRHYKSCVMDVPIVVGYNIWQNDKMKLRAYAGPTISFFNNIPGISDSWQENSENNEETDETTTMIITTLYGIGTTRVGGKAGIGWDINKTVSLDIDYDIARIRYNDRSRWAHCFNFTLGFKTKM